MARYIPYKSNGDYKKYSGEGLPQIFGEDFDYLDRKYVGRDFSEIKGIPYKALTDEIASLREQYESQGLSHVMIKAKCFEYVIDNMQCEISPHDYFPWIDCCSTRRPLSVLCHKWKDDVYKREKDIDVARMNKDVQTGICNIWPDFDHCIPDWDVVFELGFGGLLTRARSIRSHHEQNGGLDQYGRDFFDAIELEYTAILRFIRRLAESALSRVDTEGGHLAQSGKCLMKLCDAPPSNTYEVLQTIWLYFILSEYVDLLQVRSYGNLDRVLYPYYQRDLNDGTYTEEDIRRFLRYFLIQPQSMRYYWGHPAYLGGTNEDGSSSINELSYIILDEYDRMGIYDPKLQIKISPNTPLSFVEKVLDMIRRGHNSMVILCEQNVISFMKQKGHTADEARLFDISGCYEYSCRGDSITTGPLYMNLAKGVEYVITNGIETTTGERLGAMTGEPEDFNSFEEFMEAYFTQIRYAFDRDSSYVDCFEKYLGEMNPVPMLTGTSQRSMMSIKDAYSGGRKYNNTHVLMCSQASATDSLCAVKKLVFDNKICTMSELKQALLADWEGYEKLRAIAKRLSEKFGNNNTEADEIAKRVTGFASLISDGKPNSRGGVYTTSLHNARQFIDMATKTMATPDGRKRGDELSKNASPSSGMCRAGATALVLSASKLDGSKFVGDFPIDVMLHPSAISGKEGLVAMKALLDAYMSGNGHAIHFNVFDVNTLRDAQQHPEKYENLQVRVCGWNVLWNNLEPEEQENYIAQAGASLA